MGDAAPVPHWQVRRDAKAKMYSQSSESVQVQAPAAILHQFISFPATFATLAPLHNWREMHAVSADA